MSEMKEELVRAAGILEIPLTPEQLEQFETYYRLLIEWNGRVNLTAITTPKDAAVKHFADSLLLTKAVELPQGGRLADIGTGAGFPSVPAAILRPDLRLTLVDSLNKRIRFLEALSAALGLNAACLHGRAEELGRTKLRETQQVVTARAVAHLGTLAEYCLPFVEVGGVFAALKGPEIEEELMESEKAIRILGGELEEICRFTLPDGSRRSILRIRKISQTPTGYPRASAKIAKSPIK